MYALEYVEFVVQPSTVELVKDLHPDEGVEYYCVQLEHLEFISFVEVEERVAGEVERKTGGKFVNRLADDHLPHYYSENGGTAGSWEAFEDVGCRGIGSPSLISSLTSHMKMDRGVQSQCSERIHDEIQPEQLHGFEHALVLAAADRRHNREDDGGNVDRDLELSSQLPPDMLEYT